MDATNSLSAHIKPELFIFLNCVTFLEIAREFDAAGTRGARQ